MSGILSEISGLAPKDCFYIVERHKSEFTYPLHRHREFELNFVENGKGVKRVVGDSIEEIGDYDLALIAGENLEHAWEQGNCKAPDIREITIQFAPDLLNDALLSKNQFTSIKEMLEKARHGIAFPLVAVMKIYSMLDKIAVQKDSFVQFMDLMKILYELSRSDYKVLSSSSFAHTEEDNGSRRIRKVKDYIDQHFSEDINLVMLSEMVDMSPSAFSRFFKLHTNRTLTNYITEVRLGHAARELVDTTLNISQIGYNCGFNNLSNFNRVFKSKRGTTPKEFRQLYKKNKVII